MRYTPWLAYATLFTSSVSAFLPYNGSPSPQEDSATVPAFSNSAREFTQGQITTVDIKKRRTNVSLSLAVHYVVKG